MFIRIDYFLIGLLGLFAYQQDDFQDSKNMQQEVVESGPDNRYSGFEMLGLLNDPAICKELEVVDFQLKQIKNVRDEFTRLQRGHFRQLRGKSREEKADMQKEIFEVAKRMADEASDQLLPHQLKRLKQISFQRHANMGGPSGLANNSSVLAALGVTDLQKKELRAAAKKAEAKLKKELAKLEAKAREEILSVLSPKQRAKYAELYGSRFESEHKTRK